MVTTEINYDQLFKLFCTEDELRPEMMHPYKQGERYYATDATAMIFMPTNEAELPFVEQDKPQSDKVIPREKTMQIEILVSDIERKMLPEMIDEEIEKTETKECSECEGKGQVEFEYSGNKRTYTIEDDCPECDGSGKIEREFSVKTGKKIPNPRKVYFMHEVGYMYYNLERLVKAAKLCGADTITKTFGSRTQASVFDLGNRITILVMPTLVEQYDEPEIPVII